MGLFNRLLVTWHQARNERLYRRLPAEDVWVKLYGADGALIGKEKLGNWSPGGIFLKTEQSLPIEENVNLEFALGPGDHSYIRLRGQVVRQQKKKGENAAEGIGIMFTDFTQSGHTILRELLMSVADVNPI